MSAGKALAFARGLPAIGVNHLEGHLYSAHLRAGRDPALPLEYPFHGLVVSGGHAELVRVESDRIGPLARTRDDAPGEAFDKVARRAGLPYPGGPVVDRIAAKADGSRFTLPIGRVSDGSDDFSFSGLKTAVLYAARGVPGRHGERGQAPELTGKRRADLAASFQRAAVDAVIMKLDRALEQTPVAPTSVH